LPFTPLRTRFAKKNRHRISVAGFTIRSLTPVVTTLGNQFIASISDAFAYSSKNVSLFIYYEVEWMFSLMVGLIQPSSRAGHLPRITI
jgi:hypothetical protein